MDKGGSRDDEKQERRSQHRKRSTDALREAKKSQQILLEAVIEVPEDEFASSDDTNGVALTGG